ncbi:MAG: ATP-NAD kinase family protein [Pseudomonadota bacterium]
MFKLGVIVNPVAGIGGRVGLKGSDGTDIQMEALNRGAIPESTIKMERALKQCRLQGVKVYTGSGVMGELAAQTCGVDYEIVYETPPETSEEDTIALAKKLLDNGVDLILFAGGDGTARNLVTGVGESTPLVLGVPAGCKIHSGVYAVTPEAAGELTQQMIAGQWLNVGEADVVDIDENAFRENKVKVQHFGELVVPQSVEFVQRVKSSGYQDEALVISDIVADIVENIGDELWVVGSGSTCAAVMEELGLENTLLGVDLIQNNQLVAKDCYQNTLLDYFSKHRGRIKLLITVIGGQGHIFGRGNQQLSPDVIRKIGKENIQIIATRSKLRALSGRPLIADTGDKELDKELAGYYKITTGYREQVAYPLGFAK